MIWQEKVHEGIVEFKKFGKSKKGQKELLEAYEYIKENGGISRARSAFCSVRSIKFSWIGSFVMASMLSL